jgi:aspartyl-tRNA(Asn)/glutamyl-tRNA(Gln) amidotransferase subunit A
MSHSEILGLSVTALAAAIREKRISSREATRACLEALERDGPRLLAVAGLDPERALSEAAACDEELARGHLRGPLHGVPMAHKDMFYRAGRVCECGTRIRKGWVPEVTATALARLDAAGAIDLGRLNMVEWALGLTGHNAITGTPRNPWNPDHITGGSSSGPVASVAARLNFASLGSDTGGSIRYPAGSTNLVGLKPTYGRVSRHGAMPLSPSLDHVGALTRTSADAALLLRVLAGHDPSDATTSRREVPDYVAEIEDGIAGLRVAVPEGPWDVPLAPDVQARLEESLRLLERLGARPVRVRVPAFDAMNDLRRCVMMAEAAALHRPWLGTRREDYNPTTLARLEPGLHVAATAYLDALRARGTLLERFVAEVFADSQVLHMPYAPSPVPRIDESDIGQDPGWATFINRLGHFMGPANYLGLPAIAVPAGFTDNGLPTAVQLLARPFDEAVLLRVARAIERATGFDQLVPPAP